MGTLRRLQKHFKREDMKMRGKIPFEKRNRSRRGISDLLLVIVPFLVTVFGGWKGFYKTAVFAAFIVMVFNLLGLEPEIFEGTAERLQRLFFSSSR